MIGSMTPLNSLPKLVRNYDGDTRLICFECKAVFLARDAKVYPSFFEKDGEVCFGLISFDTCSCILRYVSDNQVGHA